MNNTDTKREFPLRDILAVYFGRVLRPEGLDGICQVMETLTGHSPVTVYQLDSVDSRQIKEELLRQIPHLEKANPPPDVTRYPVYQSREFALNSWYEEQKLNVGSRFTVSRAEDPELLAQRGLSHKPAALFRTASRA